MDEIYELRNEISSLKSMFNNLMSSRTETGIQIHRHFFNRFSRKGKTTSTIGNTE